MANTIKSDTLKQHYVYNLEVNSPSLRLLLGNCRACLVVRVRGIHICIDVHICTSIPLAGSPIALGCVANGPSAMAAT